MTRHGAPGETPPTEAWPSNRCSTWARHEKRSGPTISILLGNDLGEPSDPCLGQSEGIRSSSGDIPAALCAWRSGYLETTTFTGPCA